MFCFLVDAMTQGQKQMESITRLLKTENVLSLATSGEDGLASVAPLFYVVDEDLSFYWFSSESSTHSRNLKRRPRAAGTVYRSTAQWREIRGVQISGVASRETDPERRARRLEQYCERFKIGRILRLAVQRSVLYRYQPDFFRLIDNAKGFGHKVEMHRQPQGWTLARR
ncbi:MAG: pyridoxamine 5'-phosphate oxidase family protein [Terracidiphilus sp.]